MLTAGDRFEGYLVDARVGRGGSAFVYRARDERHAGRPVALKVLDARHRRPSDETRLHREFDLARRIEHPHVITMYRSGSDWLAMQFVGGGTVKTLATLSARLVALSEVADALDVTHRAGIVHCDVKPANILVDDRDDGVQDDAQNATVLIDFGAAHALADDVGRHPTHVEASLPYSAPELLTGRPLSPAVDEYALACTTFELVTGAPPFAANTAMALMDAQLHRPPPRVSHRIPWIPSAFDSIIARAMAKDPEKRYDSCSEFAGLVSHALA